MKQKNLVNVKGDKKVYDICYKKIIMISISLLVLVRDK